PLFPKKEEKVEVKNYSDYITIKSKKEDFVLEITDTFAFCFDLENLNKYIYVKDSKEGVLIVLNNYGAQNEEAKNNYRCSDAWEESVIKKGSGYYIAKSVTYDTKKYPQKFPTSVEYLYFWK
ncbi:MAG: hypothetical protein KDD40_08435, partial [Bdellovibrionales bacterium]|nr:hypothetical protein [Bdellovibrionales bacterium]